MAKILHISKYYYPYYGGIEDAAQTIVKELSPYHSQKIICFNDKNITETDVVEGVEIVRVATFAKMFSQPIAKTYYTVLNRLIKEFKPDYIHLHLPNPIVTLSLLRINLDNIKLYVHWHADISKQKLFYQFYKPFERKILFRADKIIATSPIYLEYSKPIYKFYYKSVIVPNTVNESKFIPSDNEAERIEFIKQHFGGKKILFFVGRHVPYKGIEHIVKSEKFIKEDCVFVIAGQGPLTAKLKCMAKASNRIYFIGKLSNEELRLYLKASYMFLFPSIDRSEAFGIALAEALYCGLPAVSFDIEGSGVNWVNKHNYSGLIVENSNTKAFAATIEQLIKDESTRNKMSQNATSWVKDNFIIEKAFDGLHEIYDNKDLPQEIKINVSIVLYKNNIREITTLVGMLRGNSKIDKIFLVDNSPKSDKRYKELDATYIFNNKNLGYGKGHNIALKETLCSKKWTYHIVMNADIYFESSVIDNITAYMEENIDVGALMPKVFYPNNKTQYLCRLLPSPVDLFGRRFLPKKIMKRRVERLEMRNTSYDRIIEIPYISGCFMFIRTEVLKKSGLFDERYFLYLEDIDFTRRIAKHSKTIFYPQVYITHKHNRGSYNNLKLLIRHMSSAYKYFSKWGVLSDKERKIINQKTINNTLS